MEKIHVSATLKIKPGKLQAFKAIAERLVAIVREKDSGTESYDWFLNSDETVCIVRETYESSEAVMAHIDHVGSVLGELVEVVDVNIDVFGTPSAELRKAGESFGQVVYVPFLRL